MAEQNLYADHVISDGIQLVLRGGDQDMAFKHSLEPLILRLVQRLVLCERVFGATRLKLQCASTFDGEVLIDERYG